MDALETQIIEVLQLDGRISNREIARRLDISEGTVRSRIRRLEENKVIRISAVTNLAALGMTAGAVVGVSVEGGKVHEVAEALSKLPEVRFVAITLGLYDIIAWVLVATRSRLLQILSEEIAAIPGVRRTETAEALRSVKHNYTLSTVL